MYKTSSTYACWSHGDLGDPEGDYADRWVRKYRNVSSLLTCTKPGCARPQTAGGPLCMSCFMDALFETKGH